MHYFDKDRSQDLKVLLSAQENLPITFAMAIYNRQSSRLFRPPKAVSE